jgi:hypothetical protein
MAKGPCLLYEWKWSPFDCFNRWCVVAVLLASWRWFSFCFLYFVALVCSVFVAVFAVCVFIFLLSGFWSAHNVSILLYSYLAFWVFYCIVNPKSLLVILWVLFNKI